jgi:hypothetical protein
MQQILSTQLYMTPNTMKIDRKLGRKVSLAVLLSLMNQEGPKRDDPEPFLHGRSAETQFLKSPGSS